MNTRGVTGKLVLTLGLAAVFPAIQATGAWGQAPSPVREADLRKLTITVTDENGVAVGSARLQLQGPAIQLRCETDFAGRCEFSSLTAGIFELHVEKAGFYALVQPTLKVGAAANVDVTLPRLQEASEVVNVVESTPAIDRAQISAKEEITGAEIFDIPSPGPHDYRSALGFIPGVTPGAFGEPHVAGAESYETQVLLDGFNVTQPADGQLTLRTGVDSFRSIEITPSREPAEFGKGSGGLLGLNTKMGDDRLRFTATDFVPSVQNTKGIFLSQWSPIYTVSGPIHKGKTWFIDSLDGEYDNDIIRQLPDGSDSDQVWRVDNLAKLQSNLSPRNIVTLSFLSNYYRDPYSGLSLFQPQPTTPTDAATAYIGSVKDQYSLKGGALLETGFGADQYSLAVTPQGSGSYIQTSQSAAGNYYLNERTQARRWQGLANLYLSPRQWHGRHNIKIGADLDGLSYDAQFLRQPISFLLAAATQNGQLPQPCPTDGNGNPLPSPNCARYSTFSGGKDSTIHNFESSGYVEDRWLVSDRLLIEPGLRFDWDEITRAPLVSPRLAGTYMLDDEGNTKLSAGAGIFYDSTNLGLIHQPFEGQRVDYFYDSNGNPGEPIASTFFVNRNALVAPRFVNWSIGVERKLPSAVFLKAEFIERRGVHGFAYNTLNGEVNGDYILENSRNDHYDAFQLSARHNFRQRYDIFGAYTRSGARSNQIFDFSLDFPLLSQQLAGPYGWDVPNRFVGWGVVHLFKMPVFHKVDFYYSVEARSGQPFYGTTDQGEISQLYPPGSSRLPTYYSVDFQVGKRIHLFGYYWDVRGGFNNVTNHANAQLADGIIDSSHPAPTFSDSSGRAFIGRIQCLGRK